MSCVKIVSFPLVVNCDPRSSLSYICICQQARHQSYHKIIKYFQITTLFCFFIQRNAVFQKPVLKLPWRLYHLNSWIKYIYFMVHTQVNTSTFTCFKWSIYNRFQIYLQLSKYVCLIQLDVVDNGSSSFDSLHTCSEYVTCKSLQQLSNVFLKAYQIFVQL